MLASLLAVTPPKKGPQNKSMSPERNAAARRFVQAIVDRDFGGNVSAASKAFAISQSLLYEFLGETRGAGMKLLEGVATYESVSVDQITGRSPPPARTERDPQSRPDGVRFRDIPGWAEAEAEARERFDSIPDYAFRKAGELTGAGRPSRINLYTVKEFAEAWMRSTPEDAQIKTFMGEVDAQMARDDAAAQSNSDLRKRHAESRERGEPTPSAPKVIQKDPPPHSKSSDKEMKGSR